MSNGVRIGWLISLLAFVSGCGGYRLVGTSLPEICAPSPAEIAGTTKLEVGDQVRIKQIDGTLTEGTVMAIEPFEIVLMVGEEDRTWHCSADRILSVERYTSPRQATAVLLAAGALLAVTIALVPFDLITGM